MLAIIRVANGNMSLSDRDLHNKLFKELSSNISKKFRAEVNAIADLCISLIFVDSFNDANSALTEIYHNVYDFCMLSSPNSIDLCPAVGAAHFDGANQENMADKLMLALFIASGKAIDRFQLYSEGLFELHKEHLDKAQCLYRSISRNDVNFVYQPIMDGDSQVCSYEVLARLPAIDDSQVIYPNEFINIAESFGFISLLDKKTLDYTIHKLSENPGLILSINISNLSIQSDYFVAYLQEKLSSNPHISGCLIIEMTETTQQIDHSQICHFIDLVHSAGGKIAIDDFGVGYTSWKQLRDLSIDIVKIDGSFIKNILHDELSVMFVESVVKIAKFLGIKIVAEFVENEAIYRCLQEIGIDYFQGYYFSKGVSEI